MSERRRRRGRAKWILLCGIVAALLASCAGSPQRRETAAGHAQLFDLTASTNEEWQSIDYACGLASEMTAKVVSKSRFDVRSQPNPAYGAIRTTARISYPIQSETGPAARTAWRALVYGGEAAELLVRSCKSAGY